MIDRRFLVGALGYMVGKIEWLRLRDAAKTKPGYDIRRFHDTGLSCGAVPLDMLDDVYKAAGNFPSPFL